MEEERSPDVNMNDEETFLAENNQVEKASENVDLLTEYNDATSVGLPIDNHGTIDNDDANVNTNVDLLDGNSKDLQLESVDDKDKGPESVAVKTDNNASVDVIAKKHSFSISADKHSCSKSDGSLVDQVNQLKCAAADERPSKIKASNNEKREKLDDASVVDASANELSGSKNDGFGSHVHTLNQPECAAADQRSSEMKPKLDEKGEKLVGHISKNDEKGDKLDESFFYASANKLSGIKNDGSRVQASNQLENAVADVRSSGTKDEDNERGEKLNNGVADMELTLESEVKETKPEVDVRCEVSKESSNLSFLFEHPVAEGDESGREEEQTAFAKEVENFYKERNLEFKHPKFYKEDLNLLKLWRAVIKLGGYDEVTSCKLWRQVGESFNPPKTCTTISWTFRIFYEKALLEYEKHRMSHGEHPLRNYSLTEPSRIESQVSGSPALGSGRALRDAAARAMQGWHSKRLLGSGEEKNSSCTPKSDKQIKNIGLLKRKKPSTGERTIQVANMKAANPQSDTMVIDIGPPADWVKINVQRTIDCFEVYALVPGLLREEVHVQSDPAGRLVISGQPEQLNNPWGVTSFKKVVSLPSRIDPHQTSAVVTLHGQLFVRVPFEQSDM